MRKKVRKIIDIAIILLLGIAVVIAVGKHIYENGHVKFADETMGQVICQNVHKKNVTPENVIRKDLKEIKWLKIGFCGYYETLKDLRYCTEVEKLVVNWRPASKEPAFAINQGKANRVLSKDEIEERQKELGIVLPRLSNLKILRISDFGGVEWTSLEFLENCDQIEELNLSCSSINDCSALQGCISLKKIYLEGTQIFKAEQLKGLKNIESIDLYETPIADNPEELKKLQEMYPDADIYYER